MNIPCVLCHHCPCFHSIPQPTPTSPGEDPRLAVSSGPSSYGVTALPQVPVYVYSNSGISVSPIIMEFLHWSPTGLQAKCSRDLSICQTPRLGTLNWASELSLLWEKFCDIITFQFVGCPPGRYEIWLYHTHSPTPVSLWLLPSFNSVAQLCLALCDPMDCSKPGFPVHHFFILFMGFWKQEYWSHLPFPSPGDHVLSELSTTHPSWVALHGMTHSFFGCRISFLVGSSHFCWWMFSN